MSNNNQYIRFDWAAKRMLRDKANFGVLEGLVTVLLNEEIHIIDILESEGNQESAEDKFNRVDIKARNSKDEIIIVEIQLTRELYYLERILYGVAKAITEHISLGDKYDKVKKIYSINILYFDLGKGTDYLYHGQTTFQGVHTHDTLVINTKENDVIQMKTPKEIFPEYYIIRVNEFNKVATTPLEEWLDYLKNGNIKDDTTAPGLNEARKKLQYMSMSRQEKLAYDRHIEAIMIQNDVIDTAKKEGLAEGLAEGLEKGLEKGLAEGMKKGLAEGMEKGLAEGMEKGLAEGMEKGLAEGMEKGRIATNIEHAKTLKRHGVGHDIIANVTGLSIGEIAKL